MGILVDTSVWIDYFKGGNASLKVDSLIDENLLVTNDIILAELVPYLKIKKENEVVKLLHEINRIPLEISWDNIIEYQIKCLGHGVNGVGIPDLIIAQNALENNCQVYSLDKHFRLLHQILEVQIYSY